MDYISERRMLVISVIETENPNAVPIGTKFGLFLFGEANTSKVEIFRLMSHVQKTRETEASLVFHALTMLVS